MTRQFVAKLAILAIAIWLVLWTLSHFVFVMPDELILVSIGFAGLWLWLHKQQKTSRRKK